MIARTTPMRFKTRPSVHPSMDADDAFVPPVDQGSLEELIAATPDVHCGENGILFDLGSHLVPVSAIAVGLRAIARGEDDDVLRAYTFLRTLKTNLDHYLTQEPVPGIGARDGALFADWMLLRTSRSVARDARTIDGYLGILLDAIARHTQLASLWSPERMLNATEPLLLLDGEYAMFAYVSTPERQVCVFTPQGAGELVDTLPGAQYGISYIPKEIRQHRADLRVLLGGVEQELRDEMRRDNARTYPYKRPSRKTYDA